MPVNLFEIQKSLPDFAKQAKDHFEQEKNYLQKLEQVFSAHAGKLDDIKRTVGREMETNSRLRCAVPVDEELNVSIPVGVLPEQVALLAADGSQINPSRHARVPFCVINIGAVEMVRGSGKLPRVYQESRLLEYDRTTRPESGLISEGSVALSRDLAERQKLAEWAAEMSHPAIAMVDGPLELYRDVQQTAEFERIAEEFRAVLRKFKENQVLLLGYVDKPGSDLLISLLELICRQNKDLMPDFPSSRPVRVVDTALFENILKNPGDRSAVFSVESQRSGELGFDQRVHFFFMNVGIDEFQHLARVEIPAWVADDKNNIALIQAALLDQTRMLGSKPYPYLLHRSHEVALVSMDEHRRVEEMIISEFMRERLPIGSPSQKQAVKDLMHDGGK
ncbi:MAG: DNA double-strand break repair nuclease NurA [Anaerolineaceae bacterium]|nr:DNA double-strand break repair nuclease NurA [Anaerolineaceae bacterium]